MKKIIMLSVVLIVVMGCKDNSDGKEPSGDQASIFDRSFKDYTEIDQLKEYEKVVDTVLYVEGNYNPAYRISQLEEGEKTLILFTRISVDEEDLSNISYTPVDTLHIDELDQNEFLTIGYCNINNEKAEELIAVIERTEEMSTQNIHKLWRANSNTEKIEELTDMEGVECWNENYSQSSSR